MCTSGRARGLDTWVWRAVCRHVGMESCVHEWACERSRREVYGRARRARVVVGVRRVAARVMGVRGEHEVSRACGESPRGVMGVRGVARVFPATEE